LHLGFEVVGLEFTSASSAALVIASAPAVTVAFSIVFLRERLTLVRWIGIALSIVGVMLVTGAQVTDGYPLGWLGNALVFAGVVTWGIFTVQGKTMATGYSALVSTTAATASAAVMLLPAAAIEVAVRGTPNVDAGSVGAVLYLGVGASAVAYALWNFALGHVDASVAGPFINLVPVIGVALALLVGETMTILQLVGGLTVVSGVWLSQRGAASSRRPSGSGYGTGAVPRSGRAGRWLQRVQ
jgi:drug/metabolite transporter (DMT)-like permease